MFCGNGKVRSVTVKEWGAKITWVWDTSEHGQMMGGFVLKEAEEQDKEFLNSLIETTKELIKSAGRG